MNSNPYRTPGVIDTSYEKKEDQPEVSVAKKDRSIDFTVKSKLIVIHDVTKHDLYELSGYDEITAKIEKLYGKIVSFTPREVPLREGEYDFVCEMLDGSKVILRSCGRFSKAFLLHHQPANMVSADLTEP